MFWLAKYCILHHTLNLIDKWNASGSIWCQFYKNIRAFFVWIHKCCCEDAKIVFLLQPFSVFCVFAIFSYFSLFSFSKLCIWKMISWHRSSVRSGPLSFTFLLHFQLFAEDGGDFALHKGPWYRWIGKRTFFTAWTVDLGSRALWYQ